MHTALAGSDDADDFRARLRQDGVLVRERYSTHTPGQVTGYAVALPRDVGRTQQVWFGGGKLGPDLSLTQLQRRWASLSDALGAAGKTTGGTADAVRPMRTEFARDTTWSDAVDAVAWAHQ